MRAGFITAMLYLTASVLATMPNKLETQMVSKISSLESKIKLFILRFVNYPELWGREKPHLWGGAGRRSRQESWVQDQQESSQWEVCTANVHRCPLCTEIQSNTGRGLGKLSDQSLFFTCFHLRNLGSDFQPHVAVLQSALLQGSGKI